MSHAYQLVRTHAPFRNLWLGGIVSQLGDWLSYVAISLLALERGEGPLALALILAAHLLPHTLLAPMAGVWVDRWDKRKVLVVAVLIQGMLTAGMAITASLDCLWALQGLLFIRSSIAAFYGPAQTAAIRHIVPAESLLTANTWMAAMWSTTFTLGVALGGVLAGIDPIFALWIDAATFGIAANLVGRLPAMRPSKVPRDEAPASSWSNDLAQALKLIRRNRSLLRTVWASLPIAWLSGGGWILLNLRADEAASAGASALWLGALHASRAVGTGIGPILVDTLRRRNQSRAILWRGVYVIAFAGMVAFALSEHWACLLASALAWGIGTGGNYVLAQTALQQEAPLPMLGRLCAVSELLSTAGMLMGALVGAYTVERLGINAWAGWVGLIGGLALWAWGSTLYQPRRHQDSKRSSLSVDAHHA